MSKRTTKDEKKRIILNIFHETNDFFLLKELEKEVSKKGIAVQVVKDILQELVGDNLVNSEKIGSSNYFWSFPSQAYQEKKASLEKLQAECKALEAENQKLELELANFKKESEENDKSEREKALAELALLTRTHTSLKTELDKFKDFDPDKAERIAEAASAFKDAANRWTDNIFSLESFCSKKFGLEKSTFRRNFGIPEDFDNFS